ncbi:MAG: protein kinase [Anaerolineae bacterium]|nr:protein kinase [Anaerolineae bacterium]
MAQQQFDRYQIIDALGQGGMGAVYRAYDPRFRREVALKILPASLLADPFFRTRFDREAQAIASLEHLGIVPVYDFGEADGQPYLVMRLMAGGSLAGRLEKGPLSIQEIIRIYSRLASALDVVHQQNIIHRDLKPANILFDQYGEPYLADFGLAKWVLEGEASKGITGSGAAMGTPAYMSPEQVQGEPLDGRSDVYALGVILFEMLTGARPYEATTPMALAIKHLFDPIPSLKSPDVPPAFQQVIDRAMAKKREDRYPTAAAMVTDMAQLAGVSTITPLPTQLPLTPFSPAAPPTPSLPKTPSEATQVMTPTHPPTRPAAQPPGPTGRSFPLWLLGVGGLGGMVLLAVMVVGVIWLLNNRVGNEDNSAAASNTPGPNATQTGQNNNSSGDGASNGGELPAESQTILPYPAWDPFAPFPLASAAFPLPGARTPIQPDNVADLVELAQYSRGSIGDLEYSPDGQWIAAVATEGVYLYEAADFTLVWFQELTNSNIAFHPNGQTLAVARDGDVQLWDVTTGNPQFTLPDNNAYTGFLLTYSPDGQILAASYSGNIIQLWSDEGVLLRQLTQPTGRVSALTFSPDSRQLAAAGQGITLWDMGTGETAQQLNEGEIPFDEMRYLNATTLAAASADTGIFIWDLTQGVVKQALGNAIPTNGRLAVSADGLLATGTWETIRLWREGDSVPRYVLPAAGGGAINLAFSPDGTTLLGGSVNHIARWRLDQDPPVSTDFLADHLGDFGGVAFAPDGETIAVTSENGICYVWETVSGSLHYALSRDRRSTTAVTYTPNGNLAVASLSSETQLWLGESGRLKFVTENEDGFAYVLAVAASADNRWLAAARDDGVVLIIDSETGRIRQTLTNHTNVVRAVAFFPREDVTLLATSGDDGVVNLWQWVDPEFRLITSYTHSVGITALASDGLTLAAGDRDGTIWLYDLASLADVPEAAAATLTIDGGVFSLAFAPGDGQLLAASSNNGHIEILHLAEAYTMLLLPWGGAVAFSPDGTLLAAASQAGLRVWGVRP